MADRTKIQREYYGGPTATGQMVDKGIGTIMSSIPVVGKILGPLYGMLSGTYQLVSDKIERNQMDKKGGESFTEVNVGAPNSLLDVKPGIVILNIGLLTSISLLYMEVSSIRKISQFSVGCTSKLNI
jgi:hypothetical protein